MRLLTSPAERRFLAPEVIQTSAMDCGPAALKCLLEGFQIAASYGRLREACQTEVDGTSIDTLEDVGVQLGLVAEQIMLPADHLLLPEPELLPALVVTLLPNGLTHFVVAWRRHGRIMQVMDPGVGRRWVPQQRFLKEVYRHTMTVPAQAWREWAGSEGLCAPLRHCLAAVGLGAPAVCPRGGRRDNWSARSSSKPGTSSPEPTNSFRHPSGRSNRCPPQGTP